MITEQDISLLAGADTFSKGQALAASGKVQLHSRSDSKVSGVVQGTYDYRVSMYRKSGSINFSCECPAFSYQTVCKHCVALALSYSLPASEQTSTDSPQGTDSQDETLLQYLKGLSVDTLSGALYDLICEDRHLYNRWLNKARLASAEHDLKSLKKLVTKALPLKDIWEYQKVALYFDSAEKAIADILAAASAISAEEQLTLIFHVYARLDRVLERVDDSGGYRYGVQFELATALTKAVKRADWDEVKKATWLREAMRYDLESFPVIPDDFDLTPVEMSAFLLICQADFDAIKVSTEIHKREYNGDLLILGHTLLKHLPEAERLDVKLSICGKMVHDPHSALSVCQLCLDNDDELLAEDWLLCAKKMGVQGHYQTYWDRQAIKVYSALSETEKAWNITWHRFQSGPSFYAWESLKQDIAIIGWQPDSLLCDVEASLMKRQRNDIGNVALPYAQDIVHFYLLEGMSAKAVEWLEANQADPSLLKKAAIQLAGEYPEQAIGYGTRALSLMLRHANNHSYSEAVSLLQSLHESACDKQMVAGLIREIATENKRRPNMMALLRANFAQYVK